MVHDRDAACLLAMLLAALALPALGCAGGRANASQSQNADGAATAPDRGRSTDRGSRMMGLGAPVGGITVETAPVQGGSAGAPLPPPLPAGHANGVAPPPVVPGRGAPAIPPAPSWPPKPGAVPPARGKPPAGSKAHPDDSSGLGAPPIPAPEVRPSPR